MINTAPLKNRYLLYIDVLGFSRLVEREADRVDDLFEIVASLNLYRHRNFAAIAFSDTILVHNVDEPRNDDDHRYFVMYQCEFFQNLIRRLAGRGIAVRAVLTYGLFQHYRLNHFPFFYGPALIQAYHAEKGLQVTGLLMDSQCQRYNAIFSTRPFTGDWQYVFVTQALDVFEDLYEATIPLPKSLIADTDLGWTLGPELEMLAYSAREARDHPDPKVRTKHDATLDQYRARYPKIFAALEGSDFRMENVSGEFDWTSVRDRMRDTYSWGSARQPPLRGSNNPRESS